MIFIKLLKSPEQGFVYININNIVAINPCSGGMHCNIHTGSNPRWRVEHTLEEIASKIESAKNQHYVKIHKQHYEIRRQYVR